MPYIPSYRREQLKKDAPNCAGDLNYLITDIVNKYINAEGLSYQAINNVIGALEGAKLEFYRRVAAPYEDKKINMNGDVYYGI